MIKNLIQKTGLMSRSKWKIISKTLPTKINKKRNSMNYIATESTEKKALKITLSRAKINWCHFQKDQNL